MWGLHVAGMLRGIRELLVAHKAIAATLVGIRVSMDRAREGDPNEITDLRQRIDEVELGNAKWQAECEATLMKAEGQFKAARNAEERTKTMVNHESSEGGAASEEEIFAAYRELGLGVPPGDAEAGEAEEVPQLRGDVALGSKEQALKMKFS